jgi:hypothetical protein
MVVDDKWAARRKKLVKIDKAAKSRHERAKAAFHSPVTYEKLQIALEQEGRLAHAIGGKDLPDNEPFDVLRDVKDIGVTHAIEVKTIVDGKNDKITMHPDSLRRKKKFIEEHRAVAHTVVIDKRGDTPKYYWRSGVGSFRLKSMQPVSLEDLQAMFSGEVE